MEGEGTSNVDNDCHPFHITHKSLQIWFIKCNICSTEFQSCLVECMMDIHFNYHIKPLGAIYLFFRGGGAGIVR